MFELSQISLLALFLAGVQTSAHCVVMCGVFNASGGPPAAAWWQLQAGRLLTYVLLGTAAATLGGWLLARLPEGLSAGVGRVLLGLAIVGLAILQWRRNRAHRSCPARRLDGWAFARGLGWGLMPCPLLYMALLAAAVTGRPSMGAALLLAFGLGTLPALSAQTWLLARPLAWCQAHPARRAGLIGLGGALVLLSGWWAMPASGLLCLP